MVKKEHFGNKIKKSKSASIDQNYIKFSQVIEPTSQGPPEQNLFASSAFEHNRPGVSQDY